MTAGESGVATVLERVRHPLQAKLGRSAQRLFPIVFAWRHSTPSVTNHSEREQPLHLARGEARFEIGYGEHVR
jgi:hypothetical protein